MKFNTTRSLIIVAMCASMTIAQAATMETLKSEQVNKQVSLVSSGNVKIHTFHGISNSHIIETKNELRVVDAQFNFKLADKLKAYIKTLDKPLVQVILSHNHPDHWFGSERFAADTPIAAIESVQEGLKSGAMRYIKIMENNPKMKGIIPTQVIVPSQEIALGAQSWDGLDVIVEEYEEQEAHHSMLIKIPSMGVMIGQDLFYNNMFLVASERKRNQHWVEILEGFAENEAKDYKTILVGHGKNSDPSVFTQDIEYLNSLEATLAKGLSKEETMQSMQEQFPEKGGKGMLGISLRNLFTPH